MRKFSIFTLFIIATLSVLVSCNKDNDNVATSEKQNVAVSLDLAEIAKTRAIDDLTVNGDKVTLEGTIMLYAKDAADGAILNTITLTASDFAGGKVKTIEVSGAAKGIEVEGNIDGERNQDNDVNNRQGGSKSSAVRVTGYADITPVDGSNSTCDVTVVPEMARIELYGNFGTLTTLASCKIDSVYLNNVKQKRDDTDLVKSTLASDWYKVYASGGTKGNLTTKIDNDIIVDSKADGYNFFPQEGQAPTTKEDASKFHPHLILQLNYQLEVGGPSIVKYLNVVAFKDQSGNYLSTFENGKVYQVNISDLSSIIDVPVPPTTTDPDPDQVSVDVTVTVKGWEVVAVTPEV